MKHKILVPVDFTDISAYGTKLAVQLSGYLNAAIHFIHVVHLPSHILLTNDGELFEDGDFNTDEVKKTKANAEIKIKQCWHRCWQRACSSRLAARSGHPRNIFQKLIKSWTR